MRNTIFALTALVGTFCSAAELFNGKDLSGWISVADHDATGGYSTAEPGWSPYAERPVHGQ